MTRGPTVGQLKASLSHLEFENDQLKQRTAKLEKENRSIENRLVQEQIDNGDLTARLDDARNILRDRGVEPDVRLGSSRRGDGDQVSDDDEAPRTRTLPAGRTTRPRRKVPFAQISSAGNVPPPIKDDDGSEDASRKVRDPKTKSSRRRLDDDIDHHTFHTGQLKWLPVAGANSDTPTEVR